jgi:hypothetical protein
VGSCGAYTQFCEGGKGGVDLADAAVYEDEVREGGAFAEEPGVAAGDGFAYGGEIVDDADDRAEFVVAVVFTVGEAVFETDEGGDGVASVQLGDVEALDALGDCREVEDFGEFLEGRACAPFTELLAEVFEGVLPGHGEGGLVAFFGGGGEFHMVAELLGEVAGYGRERGAGSGERGFGLRERETGNGERIFGERVRLTAG